MDRHIATRTDEFDLRTYLGTSKAINILAVASHDKETSVGKYFVLMVYGQHKKYIEDTVSNVASANQTITLGVKDAMGKVKATRKEICIITGIMLGFKRMNSLYVDELYEILRIAEEKENTLSSIAVLDGSAMIRKMIMKEKPI